MWFKTAVLDQYAGSSPALASNKLYQEVIH